MVVSIDPYPRSDVVRGLLKGWKKVLLGSVVFHLRSREHLEASTAEQVENRGVLGV
jgi:hypothetical protein